MVWGCSLQVSERIPVKNGRFKILLGHFIRRRAGSSRDAAQTCRQQVIELIGGPRVLFSWGSSSVLDTAIKCTHLEYLFHSHKRWFENCIMMLGMIPRIWRFLLRAASRFYFKFNLNSVFTFHSRWGWLTLGCIKFCIRADHQTRSGVLYYYFFLDIFFIYVGSEALIMHNADLVVEILKSSIGEFA